MKKGWVYKKLLDVCDFQGGAQPPKSEWVKNPQNGYVRMLQIRDFTQSREAVPEYVKLTNKVRTCSCDDIMVGRYGASVGKILTGLAGAYNVALMKTLPDKDFLIKPYLRFYLLSNCFQGYLTSLGGRAAQAGFSKDDLANLSIALPPLSEQKEIVNYLDSSFAKIDKLKENAAKNFEEAKALFQSALKDALEPKEGWEEKKLVEICETVTDFVAAGSFASLRENVVYNSEKDYAQLVRTTDLKSRFSKGGYVYVNEHAFKYLYRVNLDEECIILPNVGVNCGEVYYVTPSILPYNKNVLGPNAVLVRSKIHNNHFLSYLFLGNEFQTKLGDITSHMAQPKFNKTGLKEIEISIPPLSEQQSIVSYIDSLSEKLNTLQQNYSRICDECDALKQAILRQVFE